MPLHKYLCPICEKLFNLKCAFERHLTGVHHTTNFLVEGKSVSLPCAYCIHKGKTFKDMLQHYKNMHDIDAKREDLEFLSEEDFNEWKEDVERKSNYVYKKRNAGKVNKDGQRNVFFYCRNSESSNGTVSSKYNPFCPARIKLVVGSHKVFVQFISTHIGHGIEHELFKHIVPKNKPPIVIQPPVKNCNVELQEAKQIVKLKIMDIIDEFDCKEDIERIHNMVLKLASLIKAENVLNNKL